jgi:hypothetical protein
MFEHDGLTDAERRFIDNDESDFPTRGFYARIDPSNAPLDVDTTLSRIEALSAATRPNTPQRIEVDRVAMRYLAEAEAGLVESLRQRLQIALERHGLRLSRAGFGHLIVKANRLLSSSDVENKSLRRWPANWNRPKRNRKVCAPRIGIRTSSPGAAGACASGPPVV